MPKGTVTDGGTDRGSIDNPLQPSPPSEIPTWEGSDTLVSREVIEVDPDGEKMDVMTFRGSFECDVKEFAEQDPDMKATIAEEDDDAVDIVQIVSREAAASVIGAGTQRASRS